MVSQGFDPYLQRQVFPEDQDNIERQRSRHLSGRQEAAFMDLLHDLGERAGQVRLSSNWQLSFQDVEIFFSNSRFH